MAISRDRIAAISEWKSNCVVAVIGDYLGEELRKKKRAEDESLANLLAIVKNYYEIPELTAEDLITLLSDKKYYPTPNHSQEILGCALRHYLKKSGVVAAADNQLDIEAFGPLANQLNFGVKFYMLEQDENSADQIVIKEMPQLAINSKSPRQLSVVWRLCIKNDFHYDRLMPSEIDAVLHDSHMSAQISSGATRDRQLPRDDEAAMKQQIRASLAEIRATRVEETKEELKEEEKSVFVPMTTRSASSPPVITPSTSLSLQHTHAATTGTLEEQWQEFVNQEIKSLNLEDKIVDLSSLDKKAKEFNAPIKDRKILYSLWSNRGVVVSAETQEKWDRELAERLSKEEEEEEKQSPCFRSS